MLTPLYALNEDSHSIACFRLEPAIGKPNDTKLQEGFGSPVCMVFLT